ncbi:MULTISPECIES: hypothetical protein [Enterococcus]|uniref:hypothetical protein n=1 Tax=Enterococcus TaxID=1350 RepID=UPI000FFC2BDC|nr:MULTISPECIES: hypothetical protein [Enterococcus]MBP4085978.1 hypothetical protein [Enterococcus lactis]RXD18435.1 hypothetical protein EAS65_14195 [Enterococcus faecium]
MDYKRYKLFKSQVNNSIVAIEINGDYYPFVRSKLDEGYSQIVISSAVMLDILEKMFINKQAKIVAIELIEEDDQYEQQIQQLIASTVQDRAYFYNLMKELSFLSENESIEIKSIRVRYRLEEKPIDIKLSVNGLINVGENEIIKNEISFLEEIILENILC